MDHITRFRKIKIQRIQRILLKRKEDGILMKELKGKNQQEITKAFREGDLVNWKHESGSAYLAGGILSKLNSNGEQSIAINGKWVRV